MDFITKRELKILEGEIEGKKYALDSDKYVFEKKLKNGLGERMLHELNNPVSKPIKNGLFYKIKLWLYKKREDREYRKYDEYERLLSLSEFEGDMNKRKRD